MQSQKSDLLHGEKTIVPQNISKLYSAPVISIEIQVVGKRFNF